MNAESDKGKAKLFIGVLAFVALVINLQVSNLVSLLLGPPASHYQSSPQPVQFVPAARESSIAKPKEDPEEQARKAAKKAAEERERFFQRYLNPATYERKSGMRQVAVVVVTEQGRFNRSLATAIGNLLKSNSVEIRSAVFTPEFVSDGLFRRAVSDSRQVFRSLELEKFLDFVVLASQHVQYSSDPSLENVITASMQLEVTVTGAATSDQSQTFTFTASGAGFKSPEARVMAEERIIKQLQKDTRLALP